MKSNIYIIKVKVNGKYVEYDGIGYAGDLQPDKNTMNDTLNWLHDNGIEAKKQRIGEGDFVLLTAKQPLTHQTKRL